MSTRAMSALIQDHSAGDRPGTEQQSGACEREKPTMSRVPDTMLLSHSQAPCRFSST